LLTNVKKYLLKNLKAVSLYAKKTGICRYNSGNIDFELRNYREKI